MRTKTLILHAAVTDDYHLSKKHRHALVLSCTLKAEAAAFASAVVAAQ